MSQGSQTVATHHAPRRLRPRALPAAFAELLALSGLAIAQPVLDVFGRAPDVFIEADAERRDVWAFAVLVAFGPALALLLLEVVTAAIAGERARAPLHLAALGGLALLFALRTLRLAIGWHGVVLFLSAAAVAVGFMVLRNRQGWVRQWLVFASLAPIAFGALFLFSSPASSLAASEPGGAREAVEVRSAAADRPPIVLLVLDELPVPSLLGADGRLDAERFPGFDAFAKESTWFRNMTTVASHTAVAVPAILTGQYPGAREVAPAAADYPDNVFRLLGNVYRLNVSELDTQLCVVPRCDHDDTDNAPSVTTTTVRGPSSSPVPGGSDRDGTPLFDLLHRVQEEYGNMVALHDIAVLPTVEAEELAAATSTSSSTTTTIAAPVSAPSATPTTISRGFDKLPTVQPRRFSDWLATIDGDVVDPQLSVLHLTMPHSPFHLDAAGNAYQFPEDALQLAGNDAGRWSLDPGAAFSARQRHLLQVRYVDTLITALQQRLIDLGIWDDALVVVTADHGAGFHPGRYFREWDPDDPTDILSVPLFVHGPGFGEGRVDDRPVQSVDITPTFADVAGVAAPWRLDGVSLRALPAAARTQHPFAGTTHRSYALSTIDVADHLDRLLASAPAPGGDGGDDLTILRSGPSGDLIGRELSDLVIADESAGAVTQDFTADRTLATVDGRLAAYVIGHLDGGGAGQVVAVAVDGRIAATGTTFGDDRYAAHLAMLVPPAWLTSAPTHDVAFFVVRAGGSLAPLEHR